MPTPTLADTRMGRWSPVLDQSNQVQELRVSVHYDVECGEASVTGGQDFNAWPLLTQGQRNQFQNIVDKVLEEMGGL